MSLIQLSGLQSVNPDNVFTLTLDGRTIVLKSPAGEEAVLPFPDEASAIAAYPILKTQMGFVLNGDPTLTGCFPAASPAAGGAVFVVLGTNLSDGTVIPPPTGFGVDVKINGAAASGNLLWNYLCISCVAPANPIGTYNVVFTRSDGKVATLVNGFQYV